MTNNSNRFTGLTLVIIGMLLLLLNAADYIFGWNQISSAILATGLIFVVIGAGFVKRSKDTQPK
jgi:hypothetical protein